MAHRANTALLVLLGAGRLLAGTAEAPRVIAACDEHFYRHSEGSAVELPDGRLLLARSATGVLYQTRST